jgi:large subunit ribosomal protein L18
MLYNMQNLKPKASSKIESFLRRKLRVNMSIKTQHPDFRIVVNKSNTYIKAQILDSKGNVLGAVCDKNNKGETKSIRAHEAGKDLAKIIKDKNIEKVVFDRN